MTEASVAAILHCRCRDGGDQVGAHKAPEKLAISLAQLPPTLAQRRFALVVVAFQFVVCAVVAPFPTVVPRIDSFVPVIAAIAFVADLITAVLLLNQSSIAASRALLVLANGYLFSALIIIPHALTFPGAFAPKGLLGAGVQSSGLLNVFWHLGFLVAVAGYAWLKGGERRDAAILPSVLSSFCWSATIQVSLVCALTWVVTAGDSVMPRFFLDDRSAAPLLYYAAGILLVISMLVLLLMWTRRTSVLDLWIVVAICMFISEMTLVTFGMTARFYLGWYITRTLAMVVATVVLIALLSESMRLYAEVSSANVKTLEHEATVMESEARLQEALAAGAIMAFEWDAITGLMKRSDNAAQILGLDPQQCLCEPQVYSLTEKRFYSRVHPDDRATLEASVHGVRPDNPSYAVQYRFMRFDSREAWLTERASAEFDAAGRYVRRKGVIRDITERKRVRAELRDREDRMRAIVNTVVDGIITVDDKESIESLNPAAARMFGYSTEEVIGRNIKMLMPEPYRWERDGHSDDLPTTSEAKVMGPGRVLTGQRKDGTTFPVELAVGEMVLAGQRMFTGVVRDITRRKQAEERQNVLMAELDHRVKNVLARVAVVASCTRQGSRTIDKFLQAFDGRIQSMAAAHALLSRSRWQGVDLTDLVRHQLEPYTTEANTTITGPNVVLSDALTQAIAMVLHELVTNAAKYGALSVPAGRASVSWSKRKDGNAGENLILEWRRPVVHPYWLRLSRGTAPG
jgi:PAS domain S-box-containing protein